MWNENFIELMLEYLSKENDKVIDPFAGSGTTCAVAVEHGRDYIGIEANAEYCKLAKKRIDDAVKKQEEESTQLKLW